jgi:hypothetical protein
MADETAKPDAKKKPSPLEQLEHDHLVAQTARQRELDALDRDLKEADSMARDIRQKIMLKRREKMTASYGFDAKRAELAAGAETKTSAAKAA